MDRLSRSGVHSRHQIKPTSRPTPNGSGRLSMSAPQTKSEKTSSGCRSSPPDPSLARQRHKTATHNPQPTTQPATTKHPHRHPSRQHRRVCGVTFHTANSADNPRPNSPRPEPCPPPASGTQSRQPHPRPVALALALAMVRGHNDRLHAYQQQPLCAATAGAVTNAPFDTARNTRGIIYVSNRSFAQVRYLFRACSTVNGPTLYRYGWRTPPVDATGRP